MNDETWVKCETCGLMYVVPKKHDMSDERIPVWNYVPGIDETKHPNFVVKRSEIRREVLETIDRLAKDALSCLPTADNEARSALWQLSVAATARLKASDTTPEGKPVPEDGTDPFREAGKDCLESLQELLYRGPGGTIGICATSMCSLIERYCRLFGARRRYFAGEGSGKDHKTHDGWEDSVAASQADPFREAVRELVIIAAVVGAWFSADEDDEGRVSFVDGKVCYDNRHLRNAAAKVKAMLEAEK